MKLNLMTILLVLCLLPGAAPVFAQPVYQTPGANGPVFSDKPQQGAKPVELRPLTVIDSATLTGNSAAEKRVSPPAQQKISDEKSAAKKETVIPYRSFAITSPENDGSIVANTAVFEVRIAVDPALRLGEGHAFAVSINGQPVAQRFTATEFMIPPEFWGDQLPPANQRYQLAATIVDRNGAVLKEAAPVQFQLRYATVQQRPITSQPQPKPLPATTRESQGKIGEKALPGAKAKPGLVGG